jgi:hypothetical protein
MAEQTYLRVYSTPEKTLEEWAKVLNHILSNMDNSSYITIDPNTVKASMIDFGVGTDEVDAGDIPNAPSGNISSTTVQNAINELDSEKEAVSNKDTTTTLGSSDTKYPSQKAVKTYVDTGLSGKENTLTKGNLSAGSTKVSVSGGTNAVIGSGASIDVSESNLTHNNIGSKQGGTTDEYYHITSAQNTALGSGVTQSITIPDIDTINYHHFTFTCGILTGYVKNSTP